MSVFKWFVVVVSMAVLGLTGCQSRQADSTAETGQGGQAVESASSPAAPEAVAKVDEAVPVPAATAEVEKAPFVHDPSNPPVDCPLRKAGLDPTKVKPFEQTEMYIQFLEREDRAQWQKPEEVINALGLTGSERVFDLGAGSGYFTFPMAKRLKNGGHVYAGDVEPEMIRHIHHKSMMENIQNVEVQFIDAGKPEIPKDVDIIFMCDVLHHVSNPVEWLTHISNQMKAGSRFYMIEFHEGDIPQGPPESAKIPKDKIISYAQEAGLKLNREIENILPYQVFFEFTK